MGLLQGQSPCREQQSPRSWAALVEAVTQFLNQSAIIEQPGDPASHPTHLLPVSPPVKVEGNRILLTGFLWRLNKIIHATCFLLV